MEDVITVLRGTTSDLEKSYRNITAHYEELYPCRSVLYFLGNNKKTFHTVDIYCIYITRQKKKKKRHAAIQKFLYEYRKLYIIDILFYITIVQNIYLKNHTRLMANLNISELINYRFVFPSKMSSISPIRNNYHMNTGGHTTFFIISFRYLI